MLHIARIVVGLLVGLTLLAPAASAAPGYSPDDQELRFLDLINAYRAQNGLGALSLNSELGAAADFHSQDMATNNYFEHTLSDGTDPGTNIRNFGYGGSTWGENIAAGMASADDAMANWQNSPGHNAAMLDPAYSEIGIGRYYEANSAYGWYWTTTFGGNAGNGGNGGGDNGGGRNNDDGGAPATINGEPVPSEVTTTVNGVPVETDSIENTTINGVPSGAGNGNGNAGNGTVTVNGVPVGPGGEVVNADGQVITTVLESDGAVPITTDTTVAQEPTVVYDAPAPEAAPAEAAPAEGFEGFTETAQQAAPTEDGYVEATQEVAPETVPATLDLAPGTGYSADGGTTYDASGEGGAVGDGPTIVYGDIETGGVEGGTMVIDATTIGDLAPAPAPAPEAAPAEGAPAEGSGGSAEAAPAEAPPPAPEPTPNPQGVMTTTTTINGITMESGNATTYGNGNGSAQPGTITHNDN